MANSAKPPTTHTEAPTLTPRSDPFDWGLAVVLGIAVPVMIRLLADAIVPKLVSEFVLGVVSVIVPELVPELVVVRRDVGTA